LSQFSSPQDWHLNSGLDTCKDSTYKEVTLPLEPYLQSILLYLFVCLFFVFLLLWLF
jgi:hypothetical protein